MLKVFNSHAISRNQRFTKAIVWGVPIALLIGIVYGVVSFISPFEFSIVYIGIGYLIGYVIKNKGRGVHLRFSILAAGLTILAILIGDVLTFFGPAAFGSLDSVIFAFSSTVMLWLSANIGTLISLLFRVAGVYFAYTNARIV
jgi:cytochrome c biogenesis protein CcdA